MFEGTLCASPAGSESTYPLCKSARRSLLGVASFKAAQGPVFGDWQNYSIIKVKAQ